MRHGKYFVTVVVLAVMVWTLVIATPSFAVGLDRYEEMQHEMGGIAAQVTAADMASSWFDPYGWWELEGEGYAERNFHSYDLYVWGDLQIQTSYRGRERYVTDYDVWVTLDSPRLNIYSWEFSAGTSFRYPIRIPDEPPTWHNPFRLPPITKDGLTYDVEFTSATSGTVLIYGYVGGGVVVDSLSFVWKTADTDTYSFCDKSSGCNTGIGAFGMFLPLVLLLWKKSR